MKMIVIEVDFTRLSDADYPKGEACNETNR